MLAADCTYDCGGMGQGVTVTLTANGTKIGEGQTERTIALQFGAYGSPVSPDSDGSMPFVFTRTLDQCTISVL